MVYSGRRPPQDDKEEKDKMPWRVPATISGINQHAASEEYQKLKCNKRNFID